MDVLDRLTNKKALEEALEQKKRKTTNINAEELSAYLKSKVIGQDNVADEVALQIRRRVASNHSEKPIAVFCFAGPPGVGKTYFSKVLAEKLYGDSKYLQFFDMSQYNQQHSAATLFGMTKGYVGSDTYGLLCRALQNNPDSVILLDEFEKAHSEVHKRFLTAWNDGFITEASDGSRISTTQAIFILTTNAASKTIGDLVHRYRDDKDELARASKTALREEGGFAPEVLSRIDRVFSFAPLEGLDIARVVALEIEKLVQRFDLVLDDGGIDPDILLGSIERHQKLSGGGVRDIARAMEGQITDTLIDAKEQDAKVIALRCDNGGNIYADIISKLA